MNTPKPFDMKYQPQFAVLLDKLNISLAMSTYQAGKVVVISPVTEDKLIQLPRTYENAMGMATQDGKLAIATGRNVQVLKSNKNLAPLYPQKPNTYDDIYLPRMTYHTGYLALHDMAFIEDKIVAVNTLFSCIVNIDGEQNFTELWRPPFISELKPEDRCHLNGLAVENGVIKYVTALGNTDTKQGWRDNKINGGILMEYPSGKIIVEGLSMPHSPRIYNGKLYVLNSAQGTLIEIDPQTGNYETVVDLGGFARGMDIYGDYLFIGVSKLRHNSQVFRDLPIAKTSFAGIVAVYLPYKTIAGTVEYEMSVDEIYDVKVIPSRRPNILSPDMDIVRGAITFDDHFFWGEVLSEDKINQPQQRKQVNQQQSNQQADNQVVMQIMQNVSVADIIDKFGNLVCNQQKNEIRTTHSALNLIVATYNSSPIGLLVFDAKKSGESRIYSIFVREEFRKKQLATAMLQSLKNILRQNNIHYIESVFVQNIQNREIIEKLFAKVPEFNLIFE